MKVSVKLKTAIEKKIILHQKSIKLFTSKECLPQINISDEELEFIVNLFVKELSDRYQIIIENLYNQNKTLKEIGDMLHLTKERIRQLSELALYELIKDEKILFYVFPLLEAKNIIKTYLNDFKSQQLENYKFSKSDLSFFKIQNMSSFEDLSNKREEISKILMGNQILYKKINVFFNKYDKQIQYLENLLRI